MLLDTASMVLDDATVTALLKAGGLPTGIPPLLSRDRMPPSRVMARLPSGLVAPVVELPIAVTLPAKTSRVVPATTLLAPAPAAVLSRISWPAPCLARLRTAVPVT